MRALRYFYLAFHTALPWIQTPGAPIRIGPIVALLSLAASAVFSICALLDFDGDGQITKYDFKELWRRIRVGKAASDA